MTPHLDDELLARWALDGETPDAAAADHLRLCTRCRESLSELQAVVGQMSGLPRMDSPSADTWNRISTELDLDSGLLEQTPSPSPVDDRGRDVTRRPSSSAARPIRRTAIAIAASVAAILGIGAGVIGTLLVTSNDSDQPKAEAVIRLAPLAGKSGDGNADLVRDTAGTQLKVTATGLTNTPGFYEVWLINEDGKRMVSLGVLNPSTGGTFQIPSDLTGQGYRIVDVSLEPNDGNPEHSHDSIIRGTLPG